MVNRVQFTELFIHNNNFKKLNWQEVLLHALIRNKIYKLLILNLNNTKDIIKRKELKYKLLIYNLINI